MERNLEEYEKTLKSIIRDPTISIQQLLDSKAKLRGVMRESEKDALYRSIDNAAHYVGIRINPNLRDEIHFRCEGLENADEHIMACLRYAIDNGADSLIQEMDDGNIWEYCY